MDRSEKHLCIKCNEGGNLLVCSENGCPLAIHEGCMGCPARFDDAGRFYCPYCLYKQAVAESRQAREYALARKKALLNFMDEEMMGSEQHLEEIKRAEADGHDRSKVSPANADVTTCDDGESRGKVDAILNKPVLDVEHQSSSSEEEKIQEEESHASTGSEGQDPSLEMYEKEKIRNAEGKKIQEEDPETSATSSDRDPSLKMHEDKNCNPEEEQIQEEECETSSAPTGEDPSPTVHARAKRGFKRSVQINGDSETFSLQRKLVKQNDKSKVTTPTVNHPRRSSRRSSSALRTAEMLNDKVDASRSLKQPRQSLVKLANYTFSTGKRKRLLWTEEEEETLKAGVQKYSTEGNKNLPWTKILDFGQHKFDRTRTPSDLKDKWRNMMAK
ncbi:hypothetical protein Salat_0232400 [Sesamum alatum]|uniref:Myb-like domain-containing protein n=1 Tax=Sesamum alatum TaxID=300844 RepID=A0AAE2CYB3_9LAMI|nr:hypothetical protein Salat_0232400 [Sesamum alatum]